MSRGREWNEKRARNFARPVKSPGTSMYVATARQITGLLSRPSKDSVFLDLGSGPGYLLVEVKKLLPEIRAIGIDPSRAMLSIARQHADASGFRDIQLNLGSAQSIPIDASTVDLLVSQHSLHEWDDLDKCFSEVIRVLKPGGRIAIIDWNRSYPEWKFYAANLRSLTRVGWRRTREARNSYRLAYTHSQVLRVLYAFGMKPTTGDSKDRMFFFSASKPGNPEAARS